jgi:hypothetical protein
LRYKASLDPKAQEEDLEYFCYAWGRIALAELQIQGNRKQGIVQQYASWNQSRQNRQIGDRQSKEEDEVAREVQYNSWSSLIYKKEFVMECFSLEISS